MFMKSSGKWTQNSRGRVLFLHTMGEQCEVLKTTPSLPEQLPEKPTRTPLSSGTLYLDIKPWTSNARTDRGQLAGKARYWEDAWRLRPRTPAEAGASQARTQNRAQGLQTQDLTPGLEWGQTFSHHMGPFSTYLSGENDWWLFMSSASLFRRGDSLQWSLRPSPQQQTNSLLCDKE